jgi:hypothetical protein
VQINITKVGWLGSHTPAESYFSSTQNGICQQNCSGLLREIFFEIAGTFCSSSESSEQFLVTE